MSRKRYLFFDIDGTLLADGPLGYVPESTRRAIKKLEEAGHFVSIATGRAQFMAEPYMRMLEMENMVSDGGNGITIGGKLIGIEPLNKADVVALVRECEERGFTWGLAVDNSDVRLVPDERFYALTHDNYIKCQVVPGLDPEDQEIIYKAYVVCEEPEEFTLESLKKRFSSGRNCAILP